MFTASPSSARADLRRWRAVEEVDERAERRVGAATVSSSCAVLQESTTMPWRIGPCASCVANTVAPAWFSHEAQNR